MTSPTEPTQKLVYYLRIFQLLILLNTVLILGLNFWIFPKTDPLDNLILQLANISNSILSVPINLIFLAVLEYMRHWLSSIGRRTLGQAFPSEEHSYKTSVLANWLTINQWVPVLVLLGFVFFTWYAAGQFIDLYTTQHPKAFEDALSDSQVSWTTARRTILLIAALSTFCIGLVTVIINGSLLSWIKRWIWGVTDISLGLPSREARLPELNETLQRWFTSLQFFAIFSIGLLLMIPFSEPLPGTTDTEIMVERVSSLLHFLQLFLWIALLKWTKTFMTDVTTRVK